MPKVQSLIFTDGRKEYITKTMDSWDENCFYPLDIDAVIVDDSGDVEYAAWLDKEYGKFVKVDHHPIRLGFGGSIRDAWSKVPTDIDYVHHLEDDFTLNRKLQLIPVLQLLQANHNLAQVALLRQPWNNEEAAAGGIWQMHPEDYEEVIFNGKYWYMEHTRCFTTNPCVYPRWVVDVGWPEDPYSEGKFRIKILEKYPNVKFAYWGSKEDSPWVHHIGSKRIGVGY